VKISVYVGDITDAPAAAVCTSTNPRLSLMMGTGSAVRERGGFRIARACEAIVAVQGPLPVGSAHVTTAGALPHKAVIHCVASDVNHASSEAVVRLCVKNALALAEAAACSSVAMPVFATGHARVKFAQAVDAMAAALRGAVTSVREVVVVTNDPDRADDVRRALTSPSS
jgi:O-acetyl-ADP-ribose deacetylase (regulator of RNase III)